MNAKIGTNKAVKFTATAAVSNPLSRAPHAKNSGTSGLNGMGVPQGPPTVAVVRKNNV